MSHPFDLMCKRHPEREIDPDGRADRLCTECLEMACNEGARWADAHWADNPNPAARPLALPERSTDGRYIGLEYSHANVVDLSEKPK